MDNTLDEIERLVFFRSFPTTHLSSSTPSSGPPQQPSTSPPNSSTGAPSTRLRMLANLVTPIVVDSGVPTPSTPPGPALQTMANCEMSPFSLVHAPTEDDLVEDLSTCRLPNRRGALQGQGPTSTPRKFLSRIFGGLGTSAVEKGKYKTITASGEPLDGEEGELVDEGCFVDAKDTFGFDLLSMLPFELALEVFKYLDLHSILACSAVSINWRAVALDMKVWRDLFLRQPGWKVDVSLAASKKNIIPSIHPSVSTSSRPFALSFVLPSSSQSLNAVTPAGSPNPDAAATTTPVLDCAIGQPVSLDWHGLFRTRRELEQRWTDSKFRPEIREFVGHKDSVYCLEFDASRNLLVTGSRDRSVHFWELSTGALRHAIHNAHGGSVLCLRLMASEGLMITGSSDKTIIVWELGPIRSSQVPHVKIAHVLRGHTGGVLDIRVDDNWIVSCSKDSRIRVWSRRDFSLRCELAGHEGPVNAIGLQGNQLASASGDGKIILWDLETSKQIRVFEGHNRGLACIDFEGDLILSGSNDRKIKIWSASTGECLQTLSGHDGLVRALAYDASAGRLVSASYDKTVRIWDLDTTSHKGTVTAKFVRELKDHHSSHIFDIKFDAERIITSSHDESVVVMNFAKDLDTELFI